MKIIEMQIKDLKIDLINLINTKEIIKRHYENVNDLKRISLLNVKISILKMIT